MIITCKYCKEKLQAYYNILICKCINPIKFKKVYKHISTETFWVSNIIINNNKYYVDLYKYYFKNELKIYNMQSQEYKFLINYICYGNDLIIQDIIIKAFKHANLL